MKKFVWLLGFFVITGCGDADYKKYQTLMKQELASGKRVDDLFFGIRLGMASKEFFAHCWDMNKKGLFTDGENNTAVLYKLNNNELQAPASMNFYPQFQQNKIYKMNVLFRYDGWAPWNKQLSSDSLQTDIVQLYKKWYHKGNPFIQINHEKRGTIYVKVDGNRRITIGRYDEMQVKVDYTDLSAAGQTSE